MEFVTVEPGAFSMGASLAAEGLALRLEDDPDCRPHWDEVPVHEVTVSYPFKIAAHPVTNRQYAAFRPGHRQVVEQRGLGWREQDPVGFVTWHEAAEFCVWLSEAEGTPYRLPTEAEWEYAARAAGELGFTGLGGRGREWCRDWWAPYPQDPQRDPIGPAMGSVRVIRGGRVTNRGSSVPGDRRAKLGFRVVQAALPDSEPLPCPEDAAPFRNVSQQKKVWPSSGVTEEPFFSGGSLYLEPPQDPIALPYFGRHHVPALIWCDNGDLLAAVFTAPFDASTQMAILFTRLRDGEQRWDPPACFFVASDRNVTSAAFYHAPDGELHHYNGLGGFSISRTTGFTMLKRTSRDNGATWGPLRIVNEYPVQCASPETLTGEPRLWPHMDIVTLEDGTLVMPSDSGPGQDKGSVGSVLFQSKDGGDSWQEQTRFGWNADEYATLNGQAGWIAGIHAPFVVLKDGRWLALGRGNNFDSHAPWSISSDRGRTWTYSRSPFPPMHSSQRPVMFRLEEGPILLIAFTGPPEKGAERVPIDITDAAGKTRPFIGMYAALSYDEGVTWPRIKMVPVDPANPGVADPTGYLSCLQTPDKMIHLLSSKRYYRFNLAWLELPQPG